MIVRGDTKICGVIGYPLTHTLSPALHNAAIQARKLNMVFIPLAVKKVSSAIEAMKAFEFLAYAVTMPFKREVIDYLDAIDVPAKALGNVNTIINRKGILKGYNTDVVGVLRVFAGVRIAGKSAVIIGAGGAARTAAYVLQKKGAQVSIVDRVKEDGLALARECGGEYRGGLEVFQKANFLRPDILVNATPVGMKGVSKDSPVPAAILSRGMVVFDVVYNPLQTKLIQMARKRGARVITGDVMFVHQSAKQFELYSRKKAPIEVMKKAFKDSIYS